MAWEKGAKACGKTYLKTHNLSRGRHFLCGNRRSTKNIITQKTLKLLQYEIKSDRSSSKLFNRRKSNGNSQIFVERRQPEIPSVKSTRLCFQTNTQELRLIDIPETRKRIYQSAAGARWDLNNNARRRSSQTGFDLRRFQTNSCERRDHTLVKVPVKPRLGMMARLSSPRYRITPCPTENASRSRGCYRTSYTNSFNNCNQSHRGSGCRSFRPHCRKLYRRRVGESRFVIYSRPESTRRRRRRRKRCQCQRDKSKTQAASRKTSAQRRQLYDRKTEKTRGRDGKSRKSSDANSRHGFLKKVSSMFHDVTGKTSKGKRTSKSKHTTCAKKPNVSKSKISDASSKTRRGKCEKNKTENNTKSRLVCSIM